MTSRLKSLRKRDYENHFNGTARKFTLTKSLGVLFNLKKQYESKTRFNYKKVKNIEYNCHESNYKVIICNYGVF